MILLPYRRKDETFPLAENCVSCVETRRNVLLRIRNCSAQNDVVNDVRRAVMKVTITSKCVCQSMRIYLKYVLCCVAFVIARMRCAVARYGMETAKPDGFVRAYQWEQQWQSRSSALADLTFTVLGRWFIDTLLAIYRTRRGREGAPCDGRSPLHNRRRHFAADARPCMVMSGKRQKRLQATKIQTISSRPDVGSQRIACPLSTAISAYTVCGGYPP